MDPEKQNETNENTEAPVQEGAPVEETPSQFTPTPEPQMTPPAPEMPAEPAKSSALGPIVGIIIIVILIVLAGFYFWGSSLKNNVDTQPTDGGTDSAQQDTTVVPTDVGAPVSESDSVADLEAELLDTDLNNLEAELSDIEAELSI